MLAHAGRQRARHPGGRGGGISHCQARRRGAAPVTSSSAGAPRISCPLPSPTASTLALRALQPGATVGHTDHTLCHDIVMMACDISTGPRLMNRSGQRSTSQHGQATAVQLAPQPLQRRRGRALVQRPTQQSGGTSRPLAAAVACSRRQPALAQAARMPAAGTLQAAAAPGSSALAAVALPASQVHTPGIRMPSTAVLSSSLHARAASFTNSSGHSWTDSKGRL